MASRNLEVLNLLNQDSHRKNRDPRQNNYISYSILIYRTLKYKQTFYDLKMKFHTSFFMILVKKIVENRASKTTETKSIQKVQRGLPDIRGLKLSYQRRWILKNLLQTYPTLSARK